MRPLDSAWQNPSMPDLPTTTSMDFFSAVMQPTTSGTSSMWAVGGCHAFGQVDRLLDSCIVRDVSQFARSMTTGAACVVTHVSFSVSMPSISLYNHGSLEIRTSNRLDVGGEDQMCRNIYRQRRWDPLRVRPLALSHSAYSFELSRAACPRSCEEMSVTVRANCPNDMAQMDIV
jgi:hypothetical protein